jgi:hypothetical protein
MYSDQSAAAIDILEKSLQLYDALPNLNRKQTYHFLNVYRLLGEVYLKEHEDLLAERRLSDGITRFEKEAATNGLPGTADVGRMYADLGDIFYFLSYSPDEALHHYQTAVANHWDSPSLRYRIGYLNYNNGSHLNALGSFIKAVQDKPGDLHSLFALATTLAVRQDNFAAEGYYRELLNRVDMFRLEHGTLAPQVLDEHADIVETYMQGTNNLGVVLWRQAMQTGGSAKNAEAISFLSESLRAWDALNRNQETMIRQDTSNLAQENIRYITVPGAPFNPELYVQIPRLLQGESFR